MTIKFYTPSMMGSEILFYKVQIRGGGYRDWGAIPDVRISAEKALEDGKTYEKVYEKV